MTLHLRSLGLHRVFLGLGLVLAMPSVALGQAPSAGPPGAAPPAVPEYAPATRLLSGAPERGRWELRLSTGAETALSGNATASTTQLYLGLDLVRNLGNGWALGGGFFGASDEGLIALGGHFDVRYRFWNLVPYVKPALLGGAGARVAFPRSGADRSTSLALFLRFGAGLDFPLHERVLPGLWVIASVGPRALPGVAAHVTTQTLFTLSFLL